LLLINGWRNAVGGLDPVPKAIKVHGRVLEPDGSGWQEPPRATPPVPVVRELKPGAMARGSRPRPTRSGLGRLLPWPQRATEPVGARWWQRWLAALRRAFE
jgi:hypothetical protein